MKRCFSIAEIIERSGITDADWKVIDDCTVDDFWRALNFLDGHGLAHDHVQWLLRKPFNQFGETEFDAVIVMAWAIERGAVSAKQLADCLIKEELWARLHGSSLKFMTVAVPTVDAIAHSLGLVAGDEADERETEVASPPVLH